MAVVVALCFSAAGDWFLSHKAGCVAPFIAGISLFFCAHIGFGVFCWQHGRLHKRIGCGLLIGYLTYYAVSLFPAISHPLLSCAVLIYLLMSCLVLAMACGTCDPLKWPTIGAIALIVFSDTLISLNEFLHYRSLNGLILPTYYLAHLCITGGILRRKNDHELYSN